MKEIALVYFFVIMTLIGYSLLKMLRIRIKDVHERIVIILGLGLGAFPLITILLNTVGIPLHYLTYLLLALIYPAYLVIKNRIKIVSFFKGIKEESLDDGKKQYTLKNMKINKESIFFFVTLLFAAILFAVFLHGANVYEYLENDDPYLHAEATMYVSIHKTYSVDWHFNGYLEPYPPVYDVLMGILHQITGDVMWTLKFFNALIVALAIIFFYYFVLKLTRNSIIALLSTFLLTIIPSFMSHFIWSQSYALTLFPVALYFIAGIQEKKKEPIKSALKKIKYLIIAFGLVSSGIYLLQPSAAMIFLVFAGLYLIGISISTRRIQSITLIAIVLGLLLSSVYWIPTKIKFQDAAPTETTDSINEIIKLISGQEYNLRLGEQTRTFTYDDFRTAPKQTRIDQATGIGDYLFYLFLLSIIIIIVLIIKTRLKEGYLIIALLWLLFTFLGVQGNEFSINLIPHRFWVFFAIPVVLITAIGTYHLFKTNLISNELKIFIGIILLIAILITSAYPKYAVQTSMWPPGHNKWSSGEQLEGYIHLKNNYNNLIVYPLCEFDMIPVAFGQLSYGWDKEVREFRENLTLKNLDELVAFLRLKGYTHYIVTTNCVTDVSYSSLGEEKIQEFMLPQEFVEYSNPGFVMFKVP